MQLLLLTGVLLIDKFLIIMVIMSSCCKEELTIKKEMSLLFILSLKFLLILQLKLLLLNEDHLRMVLTSLWDPPFWWLIWHFLWWWVWDTLMCCNGNREIRVKFLSIKTQDVNVFKKLIGLLAKTGHALKEYRYQEGHLLIRTIFPHISLSLFKCFGSNFAKDVTSDTKKVLKRVIDRWDHASK